MKYCKAYPLSTMAAFPGWKGLTEARVQDRDSADVGYLWPDFTVTSQPFPWNRVYLVGNPSLEWESFCRRELVFSVPPEIPRKELLESECAVDTESQGRPA